MADWEAVNLPMNGMLSLDEDGAEWFPLERCDLLRVSREGKLILPYSNLSRNISRLVPTLRPSTIGQVRRGAKWAKGGEKYGSP